MDSGPRWPLIAAIILLGICEWIWIIRSGTSRVHRWQAQFQAKSAQSAVTPWDPAKRHLFTRDEANAFLDAAKKAEAIRDPLQRCLAYPDPPRSHWSHDAVDAYCRYHYQPLISFAEVQQLIQGGRGAEVDRRMAQALQDQLTRSDAHGRLDRTFYEDFNNGSFDIRPTLDAWKRDSPDSAFAWAASGYAYVAMAYRARGGGYIADTPQSNIDAMDNLLAHADTDLRRAIELDPRLTPAYSAMINAGGLGLGRKYALDAARRGLAIAPDNYAIYSMLMWLEQPKWGGSLQSMQRLAAQAQTHAKDNPLLVLLQSAVPFYEVDNCQCDKPTERAAYPAAFDQVASSSYLARAGNSVDDRKHSEASVIYLSEALRFDWSLDDARLRRAYDLVDYDEAAWAVGETNALIAGAPRNEGALKVRAYAYESMNDYAHAERDYRAALVLDPDDVWTLGNLGDMLVHWTHDWDKGWDVAGRLIAAHPDDPYGWILCADIQVGQPRPGLKDTVDYFQAHFGGDPAMKRIATRMHAALIMQAHSGSHAATAKALSPG